jgi:hypothetical protein
MPGLFRKGIYMFHAVVMAVLDTVMPYVVIGIMFLPMAAILWVMLRRMCRLPVQIRLDALEIRLHQLADEDFALARTPDFARAQQAVEICQRLCDVEEARKFLTFLRTYTPRTDTAEWAPTNPYMLAITVDAYRLLVWASFFYSVPLYFKLRRLQQQDIPYTDSFAQAEKLWRWQLPFLSKYDAPKPA